MPWYSTKARTRKGYAFVVFEKFEDAQKAVRMFNQCVPIELSDPTNENYIKSPKSGIKPLLVIFK
jgi:RNA recognition motif-containing protein